MRFFNYLSTDWAIFGSTENVCNFAKVSYFLYFFYVFMGKTNAKLEFLHIVVSAL